ncbi:MAG TPA: carboxypeptidase regulatory-like domain-containing protein [Longimicrobium sp.]|jgi:hypothetical protein
MRTRLLLPILLLGAAARLSAQTVAGEAVDPESGERISSAMVVLLDAAGSEVGSTLTDDAGRFVLRAGGPGTYTLRLERVGYANATSPALRLEAGQTLQYRLSAAAQRIQLQGIVVTGRSRCAPRAQGGVQVTTLWEEARKALRGTRGTEEARPYRYLVRRWTRATRAGDDLVLQDSSGTQSAFLAKPFVSVPAYRLELGWVQAERGNTVYFAPDADILTSGFFQESHCFHVAEAPRGHRDWVGLAFEPVRERRVPDVEGVLWLDAATAELRRLEYRYTGLNIRGPVAGRLGGEVDFHRLPDGAWIVRSWRIRLPMVEEQSTAVGGFRHLAVITALREEGGDVAEIRTAGGRPVPLEGLAQLAGAVYDSTRARPLAGARVSLSGTQLAAVTDSAGAYVLRDLAAGEYEVEVTHPRLDSLGHAFDPARVSVRRSATARRDFHVPSMGTLLTQACPRTPGTAALAGRVRSTDGVALPAAPVTVSWTGEAGADSVRLQADAGGVFRACSVPVGVPLQVRAAMGGSTATSTLRLAADQRAHQDLSIDLPRTTLAQAAAAAARSAPAGVAEQAMARTVTGQVIDASTNRPVGAATVHLGGQRVLTGRDGRFLFEEVLPGQYALQVSHASYPERSTFVNVLDAPGTDIEVKVAPAENRGSSAAESRVAAQANTEAVASAETGTDAAQRGGAAAQGQAVALQPIVATARPIQRLAGTGRSRGARSTRITREEIEPRLEAMHSVGDLVRTIPGISVLDDPRALRFLTRGTVVSVFVDGLYADDIIVRNLQPKSIESVEFIPNGDPRYAMGPILLVWTLTGERGSRREVVERPNANTQP